MNRPVGDAILNRISERHDAFSDCTDLIDSDIVDESSPVSVPLFTFSRSSSLQKTVKEGQREKTKTYYSYFYES